MTTKIVTRRDLLDGGKDADDMGGAFDFESKGAPAERKLLLK